MIAKIKIVFLAFCAITGIGCVIYVQCILPFIEPDMTPVRRFLTYPTLYLSATIVTIIAMILVLDLSRKEKL